jgi:hypothetical protein
MAPHTDWEMKLLLYRVATLFFTTTEKSVGIRRVAGRVGISPLVRVNSGVLGKGTADMDKLRFTSFTKKDFSQVRLPALIWTS